MQHVHEWLELFEQELLHIDALQVAILVFGVSEVLLARANSIWLYPMGITATVLAIFSLYDVQLYAECLLHGYYLVMSVYGWWYWSGLDPCVVLLDDLFAFCELFVVVVFRLRFVEV